MGDESGGRRPPVDVGALVPGARYRVDWKDEGIRRTFRTTGTFVDVREEPGADGDAARRVVRFEVRPRFGRPTIQPIDAAALVDVVPV